MGCIYYHKNKINKNMYIGQSINNFDTLIYTRWGKYGQGYRGNSRFWNAICKYGWDNFEHGCLVDNVEQDKLNQLEQYYIAFYHTYIKDPESDGGYNLTPGGETSYTTWEPEEDLWLVENYSKDSSRASLAEAFKLAFPKTVHTDMAIYARLKTLHLSSANNIHFWTDEELALLIELWPTDKKSDLLSAFPNRSYEAIRSKAKTLNLPKRNSFMESLVTYDRDGKHIEHEVYMPYTAEEDALLCKYYPEYGIDYCLTKLKTELNSIRTYNSVRSRVSKVLKLKRKKLVIGASDYS